MSQSQRQPNIDELVADLEYVYQIRDKNRQNQKLDQFIHDLHQLKTNSRQSNVSKLDLNEVEESLQNFKKNL